MPRQIPYVGRLRCGKSQAAHPRGAEFEDALGRDYALDGGGEPAENHTGHAAAELLENDGLNQSLEIRLAKLDTIIANPFDNGGEHRIVGAEVVNGLLHLETLARRARPPYCTGMRILTFLTLGSVMLAQDQASIKVDVDRGQHSD